MVAAGKFRKRSTFGPALAGLGLLRLGQFRFPAHALPALLRPAAPLGGAGANKVTLHVREGGVATSGIDARLWVGPRGALAHHLIDPASGMPAWTGLIAVTALAPTALEADALAKAALLSGPKAGRRLLCRHQGGLLVHDDGAVERVA